MRTRGACAQTFAWARSDTDACPGMLGQTNACLGVLRHTVVCLDVHVQTSMSDG